MAASTKRDGPGPLGLIGLCVALVVGACSGTSHKSASHSVPPPERGPFEIALGTGRAATLAQESTAVVDGDPLDPEAVAAVTRRLPAFHRGGDGTAFRRPTDSIRRPRV